MRKWIFAHGDSDGLCASARVPEEKFSEFIEELDKTLQTLPRELFRLKGYVLEIP